MKTLRIYLISVGLILACATIAPAQQKSGAADKVTKGKLLKGKSLKGLVAKHKAKSGKKAADKVNDKKTGNGGAGMAVKNQGVPLNNKGNNK